MPKIVTSSPRVTKYAMKASRTAAGAKPKIKAKAKTAAVAGAAGVAVAGTAAAVSAHKQKKAMKGQSKAVAKPAVSNQKALTAQKVGKYAGYAGLAGAGLGLAAKQGAGMKVGGQVGHNVLSKSAKGLGAVGAIGGGTALTAAYYQNKRDKQMGVSKGTRRLNAAGTATGMTSVQDKSAQIRTAGRVPKKGQSPAKGRSQCKGNCQHR